MTKKPIVTRFESDHLKNEIPSFNVGDTVRVHTRIIEGNKERVQIFTGTVIARKGSGLSETFSVHRVAYGEGMERVFLLHSPRIAKIEVVSQGDVRRSKLYYLRGTHGKKAKVKSLIGRRKSSKEGNGETKPEEIVDEEELKVNGQAEEIINKSEQMVPVSDSDEQVSADELSSSEEETEKADA